LHCLQYVLVTLNASKPVMFGGTEEPAAYGELLSIGAIGGGKNKQVQQCTS
jgi:phenylpyruvate tautomerase